MRNQEGYLCTRESRREIYGTVHCLQEDCHSQDCTYYWPLEYNDNDVIHPWIFITVMISGVREICISE